MNRKMRDGLPSLQALTDERLEVRDRDRLEEEKGREYMDNRHHARPNELKEGEWVLAERMMKRSKFDTNFNQEPCVVVTVNGPEAVI